MRSLNSVDATTSDPLKRASSTSSSSIRSISTKPPTLRAVPTPNPRRGLPTAATNPKPRIGSTPSLLSEGGTTITEPRRTIRATISSNSLRKQVTTRNSTPPAPGLSNSTGSRSRDTSTSTAAATRSVPGVRRLAALPPRVALNERDHNAVMTRPVKGSTPLEKGSSNARGPTLSAAAVKAMGRAPLTPKIATASSPAPRIAQSGATTPLGRRGPAGGRDRDDYASPVAPFLSSNVTPRSGSRQSRVDSTNSTPCGTPNPEQDRWETRSGLGISSSNLEPEPIRRAVTFSPASEVGSSREGQQGETKFFFASDAKNVQQKPVTTQPRSGANFFYANGDKIENKQNANSPVSNAPSHFSPMLGHAPENRSSKFIYANGVPDLQPSHNQGMQSKAGSVVSTSSRMTATVRPSTAISSGPHSQRPASPIKMAPESSHQQLKVTSQTPVNNAKSPGSNTPVLGPTVTTKRGISVDTTPRGAHSRNGSLTVAAEASYALRTIASLPSSEASTPSNTSNPAMTMASILQTADEAASPDEVKPEPVYSELHSPTKASHSTDQLNELVANARRERKVQDLEITNASLAAINRTLERQLRKQTAEIRRFRRLSRSGRLSLASNTSSLVSPDSIITGTAIESLGLSDLDEEDLDEEDSLEESDLSDSDSGSGSESLSPNSRAARDAKHRKQDERRLELDLSKHRELLVDSQKINQSIRRCLNWTEELIQEGRKALAYQVRVSDIEFGGRVLAPPDEDDSHSSSDRDADENMAGEMDGEATIHGVQADDDDVESWCKEPQDRDSGIELPSDGG